MSTLNCQLHIHDLYIDYLQFFLISGEYLFPCSSHPPILPLPLIPPSALHLSYLHWPCLGCVCHTPSPLFLLQPRYSPSFTDKNKGWHTIFTWQPAWKHGSCSDKNTLAFLCNDQPLTFIPCCHVTRAGNAGGVEDTEGWGYWVWGMHRKNP